MDEFNGDCIEAPHASSWDALDELNGEVIEAPHSSSVAENSLAETRARPQNGHLALACEPDAWEVMSEFQAEDIRDRSSMNQATFVVNTTFPSTLLENAYVPTPEREARQNERLTSDERTGLEATTSCRPSVLLML
jgi:hypothetical protein